MSASVEDNDHINDKGPPLPQDTYQRYVNYGYFQRPEQATPLHLRLDTWYYLGFADMGTMHFGVGPVFSEAGGVEAVANYLSDFREAFNDLFQLDPQSIYRGAAGGVLLNSPTFVKQLAAQLTSGSRLGGTVAHFNVRALVRDDEGHVVQQWLTGGDIWLYANRIEKKRPAYEVEDAEEWAWSMKVILEPGSLFRPNNQQALSHVRSVWKRLRQRYPEVTCFADAPESEGLDAEPDIVTLAEPPLGTPSDNRELSALNLPQLQAAVTHWEHITGRPFEWAEPFRKLGLPG